MGEREQVRRDCMVDLLKVNQFHYSIYWHRWSRVLWTDGDNFIELNLTPIPNSVKTWEDVKKEMIRYHAATPALSDTLTDRLPTSIVKGMVDNLGIDLTIKLQNYDYLTEIAVKQIGVQSRADQRGGGLPVFMLRGDLYMRTSVALSKKDVAEALILSPMWHHVDSRRELTDKEDKLWLELTMMIEEIENE